MELHLYHETRSPSLSSNVTLLRGGCIFYDVAHDHHGRDRSARGEGEGLAGREEVTGSVIDVWAQNRMLANKSVSCASRVSGLGSFDSDDALTFLQKLSR